MSNTGLAPSTLHNHGSDLGGGNSLGQHVTSVPGKYLPVKNVSVRDGYFSRSRTCRMFQLSQETHAVKTTVAVVASSKVRRLKRRGIRIRTIISDLMREVLQFC